ncbi:hypothetical protein FACS1894162_4930 [Bacteroidia bacterium]|nr:hypothetical protein FACS1894162_4930 [Bacteroidia bacterium]
MRSQTTAIDQEIPKMIFGIETDAKSLAQRRIVIKQTYVELLNKLQLTRGKKAVYNDFLGVDVYIIMRESGQKTSNSGVYNWQSTYAVKNLETVIKNAKPMENIPIYTEPKQIGKQKDFKYVNMAILWYTFENEKYPYLNFTVKLTLGIKNDGRHIQYSVNKLDVKK